MKITKAINDVSLKCYLYGKEILPFLLLAMIVLLVTSGNACASGESGGTNYLSGLKGDVKSTFGSGSDTEYYLYLGEGLVTALAWIKTKNVMALGALPVLMIFTHWALK